MLNKKGISSFALAMWMLRFVFMGIVFLSIYFLVSFYSRVDVNTINTEPDILVYSMIYSPHGLSYYDPISNRVYPGIIEVDDADAISLISYSEHTGAMISVKALDGSDLFNITINPKTYMRRAESLPGPGGFDLKTKEIYVLARHNGELVPAIMEAEVVVQRYS